MALHDLPRGWDKLLRDFLDWMPKRLDSYEKAALRNTILKGRSQGVAAYGKKEALDWGCTGAALRATGIDFDVRKSRPYSGYENFDFEIPVGGGVSDCYTRVMLKVEELRQSLRILEQCLNNMPEGPFKSGSPADHAAAERAHATAYRNPDHPLPASVVGPGYAGAGILPDGGSDQGYQQLLPDQRWQHHELPYSYSYAELCAFAADPGSGTWQPGVRPYRPSG